MQALMQTMASLVATMACAAFAHFGVALKEPCPTASAHQLPVSAPAAPAPAMLATDVKRT
jgi:hypothetical protein